MSIVSFRHPDGIRESTRLTASVAAAATTLSVRNSDGLSASDYIILGSIGSDRTEIVKITTVDSAIQLTIAATSFTHDRNDLISYTPYNQIRFYSATTESGTKTTQGSAVDLEVEDLVTEANLSAVTSGYVFARYYNETTSGFSSYSPAVPVAGFAEDSLRHIIDMVRLRTQEKTEDLISDNDYLNMAKECSDEIETVRKNWSFVQTSTDFNVTAAIQTYSIPSDLAGYNSIASMYLGYDNVNLNYVDMKDFRYNMRSIPKTVTTGQIISGATSISVKDTSAFGTSGTLVLGGDTSVTYSGRTYISFSNVTGVTATHVTSTEIFRSGDLDQPRDYTVWENNFLLFPVPDKFYNCNVDYYKTIPRMTDVSDETVVPMPSLFIWYLMAETFSMRVKISRANKYSKKFQAMLDKLTKKNRNKQIMRMQPAKNYIHRAVQLEDEVTVERMHGGA